MPASESPSRVGFDSRWRELDRGTPRPRDPDSVLIAPVTLSKIKAHVQSTPDQEQIGVLLGIRQGRDDGGFTVVINDSIALEADSTLVSVRMHRRAWSAAWRELDQAIKSSSLLGWYHSHPGHGIFLSEIDLATHHRWFAKNGGIALVVDPVTGTLGFFVGGREIPAHVA